VNELVSNAIKHGRSRVDVDFRVSAKEAVLTVCDDGPGFPEPFDPERAANTGLELVENLSRWDLAGHTSYRNRPEGGASVKVFIPLGSGESHANVAEETFDLAQPRDSERALAGAV
jgi:two-component sensor histidine kinase